MSPLLNDHISPTGQRIAPVAPPMTAAEQAACERELAELRREVMSRIVERETK